MSQDARRSLEYKLGKPVIGNDEIRFLCPFCAERKGSKDTKHHMYINFRKEKWICFRCGAKGAIKYLLEKLGIAVDEDSRAPTSLDELNQLIAGLEVSRLIVTDGGAKHSLQYPCDTKQIAPGTDAWSYLKNIRKYSTDQIERMANDYKMVTGYHVKDNRIFIPTFDEYDDMVYWVARACLNRDSRLPKYVNPENTAEVSKSAVFNLYRAASLNQAIVVCEGVFSAIACGDMGVAVFGKTATPDQVSVLCSVGISDYIVCLDSDALKEAYDLASAIQGHGKNVSVAHLPDGEDPDSMEPSKIYDCLLNATTYNTELAVKQFLS